MKVFLIISCIWIAFSSASATPSLTKQAGLTGIIPEPQEVYKYNSTPYKFSKNTILEINKKSCPLIKRAVELFAQDYRLFYSWEIQIKYSETIPVNTLLLGEKNNDYQQVFNQLNKGLSRLELKNNQGYGLIAGTNGVLLKALSPSGIFYGAQTLRQLLKKDRKIPATIIHDWPDQKWRAVYLTFPSDPEWIVDKMARLKVNMCIVESRWYAGGNWWYNPYGKNRKKAKRFIELCRQNNIEPVPLVNGLGWAYGVVDINPNCSEGIWAKKVKLIIPDKGSIEFPHRNLLCTPSSPIKIKNPKGLRLVQGKDYEIIPGRTARPFAASNTPWRIQRLPAGRIKAGEIVFASYNYMNYSKHQSPYCPSEPQTYKQVDNVLTNTVKLFKPKFIHIGHDEVIYKNRCSRCKTSGKSTPQLIGEDIQYWYKKIKKLDSSIEIMMWDDLLRPEKFNGKILNYVSNDVIICPWLYTANKKGRQGINDRLAWFVKKHKRPTFGVASGYFHENVILWDRLGEKYSAPNNYGFMFSHWGESESLWAVLATAAELMWSHNKPSPAALAHIYNADYILKKKGLRTTLSAERQMNVLAKLVNKALTGGKNYEEDAGAFSRMTKILSRRIKKYYIKDFKSDGFTLGTFPENTVSQLNRLNKIYSCMSLYGNIKASLKKNDIKTANRYSRRLFAELKSIMPFRTSKINEWEKQWQNKRLLPPSKELFKTEIKTLASTKIEGMLCRIPNAKRIKDQFGECIYKLNNTYRLAAVEISNAADGMYQVMLSADGAQYSKVASVIYSVDREKVVFASWPVRKARYIKIKSNEPKELVKATVKFFAEKLKTAIVCKKKTGNWRRPEFWSNSDTADLFVTRQGNVAAWQTKVALTRDDTSLYVRFTCAFPAGKIMRNTNAPIWDDDCVQLFVCPPKGNAKFYQVIVNSAGKSLGITHGFKKALPVIEVENKIDSGKWTCAFAVPLKWLGISNNIPATFKVNFGRNNATTRELSSWSALPRDAAYWFLQPQLFNKLILK